MSSAVLTRGMVRAGTEHLDETKRAERMMETEVLEEVSWLPVRLDCVVRD